MIGILFRRNWLHATLCPAALKPVLFGMLTLALGACANHDWVPGPGMNAENFGSASARCTLNARQGGGGFAVSGSRRDVIAASVGFAVIDVVRSNQDYNLCMQADGWRIADKPAGPPQTVIAAATQAPIAAPTPPTASPGPSDSGPRTRAQIFDIASALTPCVSDIRAKPAYQTISHHLIPLDGARFTMAGLSDERTPSVDERRVLAAYIDETAACRAQAMESLFKVAPTLAGITMKAQLDNEKTILLLVRGKLTWGEGERRQQDTIDALAELVRNTPA